MALETFETDVLVPLGNAWAMRPTAIGTRRVMSAVYGTPEGRGSFRISISEFPLGFMYIIIYVLSLILRYMRTTVRIIGEGLVKAA
jgi:hypothetical protein